MVLEPGCGIGHFIGYATPGLACRFVGVEADAVSAGIAALLCPDATVHPERFEQVRLAPASFDAAVGNVPNVF